MTDNQNTPPVSKEPGNVSSTASPGSPPTSPISVASSKMRSAIMEHNASNGLIPLDRLSTSAQGQDAASQAPTPSLMGMDDEDQTPLPEGYDAALWQKADEVHHAMALVANDTECVKILYAALATTDAQS